jgi:membrane associated rhomboid family serine protease
VAQTVNAYLGIMERSNTLLSALIPSFIFPVLILFMYLLEPYLPFRLQGIQPRSFESLMGIFTYAFKHSNVAHLRGNVTALFVLIGLVQLFYPKRPLFVFMVLWILGGFWTWLIARQGVHVGASVLVYGYLSFIVFSTLYIREKSMLALALLTLFLYGSGIWGIFPIQEGVSWEGHFSGLLSGLFLGWSMRSTWKSMRPRVHVDDYDVSEEPGSTMDPYRIRRNKERTWEEWEEKED